MGKNIVRGLIIMAMAVVLAIAIALPAGAGPSKAQTYTATDFFTGALDANGDFKTVYCKFAKLTLLDGKASETYHCEFLSDSGAVLPESAMTWNYENSYAISGPWRWFSDVEDINNIDGDPTCFMYTQPKDAPPGDSSWSEVLTPSGQVNVTVKYRPPYFGHPDGTPCIQ
jgi:hypothetical protein